MGKRRWTAVDRYIDDLLVRPDPALDATLRASKKARLPAIHVTPAQGKLLMLLARARGARAILEIGTLGGYSTIWLARGLSDDGRLVSLEANPGHAEVARANLARAGLAGRVDIRLGRGLDLLPALAVDGSGPFDLVFIDADKPSLPDYFDWAVRLSRPGSLILVDNVVRDGKVIDEKSDDESVRAVRRMHERIAADPRVTATSIQTVGAKGYDGFTMALVLDAP